MIRCLTCCVTLLFSNCRPTSFATAGGSRANSRVGHNDPTGVNNLVVVDGNSGGVERETSRSSAGQTATTCVAQEFWDLFSLSPSPFRVSRVGLFSISSSTGLSLCGRHVELTRGSPCLLFRCEWFTRRDLLAALLPLFITVFGAWLMYKLRRSFQQRRTEQIAQLAYESDTSGEVPVIHAGGGLRIPSRGSEVSTPSYPAYGRSLYSDSSAYEETDSYEWSLLGDKHRRRQIVTHRNGRLGNGVMWKIS